ncbi:MAG: hypothetical protein NDJ19_00170 [Ramlibacter sp.]|nr:hypothetical protein [Ramlibacter sp.]
MACALLAVATATAAAAAAAASDPLSSPECTAARAQLDKAIDEAVHNRQADASRMAQARRRAGEACLGSGSGSRSRSGAPDPPRAVPPAVIGPRPAQAQPPAAAVPPPPLAIPRAPTITTCDPAGCWDSEGRRLNSMGPLLIGPNGLCTLQAGVLNCP